MKTKMTIQARMFPVTIRDQRTGEESTDMIVFSKAQLKAAEDLGLTPDDLIHRRYNEQGYYVLETGKARKQTIAIDLKELYKAHCLHETGKREACE